MPRGAVAIGVAGALCGALGCADGVFFACAGDDDCGAGLVCVGGTCARAPAGGDGGTGDDQGTADAGPDDAGDGLDAGDGPDAGTGADADPDDAGDGLDAGDGPDAGTGADAGTGDAGTGGCPAGLAPRELFPDADEDGFTGPPVVACAGEQPPAGTSFAARPAPVFLVAPQQRDAQGWDKLDNLDVVDGLFSKASSADSGNTRILTLAGFTCLSAPDEAGAVAMVLTGGSDDGSPRDADVVVSLSAAGRQSAEERAFATWPQRSDPFIDVTVGGDAFGLALSPADVCAPDFGINVHFETPDNNKRTFRVDAVALEVFGAPDCDDGDPAVFSPASVFLDADGDGHGDLAQPASLCLADGALPEGFAPSGDDCDDVDPKVFTGQTGFFGGETAGGGYDYNCDGSEEPNAITSVTACTTPDGGLTCSRSTVTLAPTACGSPITVGSCNASCTLTTSQGTQLCR